MGDHSYHGVRERGSNLRRPGLREGCHGVPFLGPPGMAFSRCGFVSHSCGIPSAILLLFCRTICNRRAAGTVAWRGRRRGHFESMHSQAAFSNVTPACASLPLLSPLLLPYSVSKLSVHAKPGCLLGAGVAGTPAHDTRY